ncbi:HNH endonuclease [Peribacillus loiseleuriae]|uniref:HNH endonuclease n=1 Tax=Peribacillus loiseleuriae TaxID=1679170 RepID=UPI003D0526E1
MNEISGNVEYGEIMFNNIPSRGYMRHLKKIQEFYEQELIPNIEYYKSNFGYYQIKNKKSYYTLDFPKLDLYKAERNEALRSTASKQKDLIYGDFYFENFSNPENKKMGNLLKKYRGRLREISDKSELITLRYIRGKSYYQVLSLTEKELANNLELLGFKEDLAETIFEIEIKNESKDISESNFIAKKDVQPSSYKNEPIGSTMPTIVNKPVYKLKKSRRVVGEFIPERKNVNVSVVQRKQSIVHFLKELYRNTCQICGEQIEIGNGKFMCEVHHIQPLGSRHNGADVIENMIVVCPNHHAMFDRGAITIDVIKNNIKHVNQKNYINMMPLLIKHRIAQEYVDYHNQNIYIYKDKV